MAAILLIKNKAKSSLSQYVFNCTLNRKILLLLKVIAFSKFILQKHPGDNNRLTGSQKLINPICFLIASSITKH